MNNEKFIESFEIDEWEIETEDGEKLIITGNNPVWLPDLHCYRRVEDLEIGDVVLSLKD